MKERRLFTISLSKQKVVHLNSDCRLYLNLYIASQARQCDLDECFAHENYAFPFSISEYSKLRAVKDKSEFTQLLHKVFEQYEEPTV